MLKKRFAVVVPWLEAANAETEAAQRYRRAATNLGIECIFVDRHGYRLDARNNRPDGGELDFVICPHFALPKTQNAFSFAHLVNPAQYFHDWGYDFYTRNLLAHDDFLSCGSVANDDQVGRSLLHDPLHLPPLLQLHSTVSEPVIEPVARDDRRLSYISAGWDEQRNRDLLQTLDRHDAISIYGSRYGNWSGWRNFRGELPFDGRAVVERIAEHGALLALFSPAHIEAGALSNRLFEGLAAGVAVICDQHPFARRHFGDSLLYIDTEEPDAADRILAHLDWINAHPDEATRMAREAQQIFRKDFSADVCLKRIYDSLEERKKALTFGLDPAADTNPLMRVIYVLTDCSEAGLDALVEACCEQDYRRVQLQVLVEPDPAVEKAVDKRLSTLGADFRVQKVDELAERSADSMGSVLAEALQAARKDDFDYLCVITSAERPFSNQLSSLVRLMQRCPDCTAGASAEVFIDPEARAVPYREGGIEPKLQPHDPNDFGGDPNLHPSGFARFVFRRQVLDAEALFALLPHLNRKAMAALVVGQSLARSALATVRVDRNAPFFHQPVWSELEDPLIRQVHPSFESSAVSVQTRMDGMGGQLTGRAADPVRVRKRKRRRRLKLLLAFLLAVSATMLYFHGL